MARKQAQLFEGYSSDSGGSSDEDDRVDYSKLTRDEQEETELMGSYGRKRKRSRRRGFMEGDDEAEEMDREARGKSSTSARQPNYLRPQSFVPASATTGQPLEAGDDGEDFQDGKDDSDDESEEADREPMDLIEEEEMQPTFGGIGSRSGPTASAQTARNHFEAPGFQSASFVSSRSTAGIGSGRQGIGSSSSSYGNAIETPGAGPSRPYPSFAPSTLQDAGMPTSFGAVAPPLPPSSEKPKRSFLGSNGGASSSSAGPSFPKTSINFGTGSGGGFNPAAYLASMGWTGGGLGEKGEGMLNPIEVQLRPERAGIAFGGRKERTKQAKDEARRRGEEVSSDEEDRRKNSNVRGHKPKDRPTHAAENRSASSKKTRKPRVEHLTYEQIIEQAGHGPSNDPGIGQIYDARTGEMREFTSLASALSYDAAPSSESGRLEELRYHLQMIIDHSSQTLDVFAKEAASIRERSRWLQRDAEESKRRLQKETAEADALRVVVSLAKEMEIMGKESMVEGSLDLQSFRPLVERLEKLTPQQLEQYSLDEAVVGAITPTVKRVLGNWLPLEDAHGLCETFKRWQKILKADYTQQEASARRDFASLSVSGSRATLHQASTMTPFESLLWHIWMPRVRGALNNDWKPHHPRAAVALLSTWKPLLPRYIWDNILDQILLPKLMSTVRDWEPRTARASLHYILFPWLEMLDDRNQDLLAEARRRIRASLKTIKLDKPISKDEDPSPSSLAKWKEFYSKSEWDSMLLTQLLPRLASHLQSHFRVNPAQQDVSPLERVLAWIPLLSKSTTSRLIETGFFAKWLTTLHTWLIQSGVDYGEVAQWYSFWKEWFPATVSDLPGVQAGFQKGIVLLNESISLDESQKHRLKKPDLTPVSRSSSRTATPQVSKAAKEAIQQRQVQDEESISLRSIVESRAAAQDLLIIPLHQSHPRTGLPLFKVTSATSSKGGITFYIKDDIIWMQERQSSARIEQQEDSNSSSSKEWKPVGVEELLRRAKGDR